MAKSKVVGCTVCGAHVQPNDKHTIYDCVAELQKHIEVDEKLLNERTRLLDAIPDCPVLNERAPKLIPFRLKGIM